MKKIYSEQWDLFKSKYFIHFIWIFSFLIFSIVASYYFLLFNSNLVVTAMEKVLVLFREKNMMQAEFQTFDLAFDLFLNNSIACILIILSGFLPIFLPMLFIIGINGIIIGVLLAFLQFHHMSVFEHLLTGIIPHGVFEIPAMVLAGAISVYISLGIYKKFNDREFSFKTVIVNAFKTFIFICLPLLLIAAIVESFITPKLIGF